jgi:hypothetical protein
MLVMKKYALLIIMMVFVLVLYSVLTPKSVSTMKADAFSEFDFFMSDNGIEKEQFVASKILIDANCLIFRWDAYPTISDTISLYIKVPSYGLHSIEVSGLGSDSLWKQLKQKRKK